MPTPLPPYLTDEQRAIITADVDHAVITAVAGSGKTTTLAWRIRYLLEQGQDPARLLVLMFNRSARQDFQAKLRHITQGTGLRLPDIRTYHAMGYRLYRRFVQEGALPPVSDQILTDQEINFQVWQLTRQLAPEHLQDELKRNKKELVETAAGFIDRVKTTLSPVEVVFEQLGFSDKYQYLVDLFHSFEQWRKTQRRISYADMLYEPVSAIHQSSRLQRLVSNKMDLILVDEYQDTNEIQHLLLRYVAGERARVTVVGDPDQTIYEFRGARPEFILNRFSDEFESPRELTLTYSFRYGHRVALLANHLISHNTGRKDVLCHAHPSTPDTRITLHETEQEVDQVLALLAHYQAQGTPLSDIALLLRLWSQSVAIELALLARQLPYVIDVGKGALFTSEAAALIALLQVCSGQLPAMTPEARFETARQLLRFPHVGLKEQELNALARLLSQFQEHWGQRLLALDFDALPAVAGRKLKRLGTTLNTLAGFQGNAASLLKQYSEGTELNEGLRSLALTHEAADERIATLRGFQQYLQTAGLDSTAALAHLQALQAQAAQSGQTGVRLATLHRTKGLEWPVVILPGLQEKHLPYTGRPVEDLRSHIEAERRLLYVGITRSRQALHLITRPNPSSLAMAGENDPSRFVAELHAPLADRLGAALCAPDPQNSCTLELPLTPIAKRYAARAGITLLGPEANPVGEGTPAPWQAARIRHSLFGRGSVTGERDNAFDVTFDSGEQRSFSKQSAHLYFTLENH
ncbi:MAG: ATP-dependent helicase [Marinobacter sp.]|nr:ATP-dependent helicase [Marinobacter sp.]